MTRFALDEYLLHCCLMKLAINYYQYLLVVLEFASLVDFGLASPSTVPAFLWSPHLQYANGETDVNYQVMSAKDLVDSVFTLGGWSNFLCSEKKLQQPVDLHSCSLAESYCLQMFLQIRTRILSLLTH
ncbi:hypothetical protein AtEden1_Chr1g0054721 [Arabidopsis thaliana]